MKLSDTLFSVAGIGVVLCALCWWCLFVVATARYFAEYWKDRQFGIMALTGGLLITSFLFVLVAIAAVLQAIGA